MLQMTNVLGLWQQTHIEKITRNVRNYRRLGIQPIFELVNIDKVADRFQMKNKLKKVIQKSEQKEKQMNIMHKKWLRLLNKGHYMQWDMNFSIWLIEENASWCIGSPLIRQEQKSKDEQIEIQSNDDSFFYPMCYLWDC